MKPSFEVVLQECLQQLGAGQSLEDCLAAYPHYAENLRPLLEAAISVGSIPLPHPRPEALLAGRQRVMAVIEAQNASAMSLEPNKSNRRLSRYTVWNIHFLRKLISGKEPYGMQWLWRLALTIALGSGSIAVTNASAQSLPGDPLYGVKRSWEQVTLSLSTDPEQLQTQYLEERHEEIQQLWQQERQAQIDFEGVLELIQPNEWTISGLTVQITENTVIEGTPHVGMRVKVQAEVEPNNRLTALQIIAGPDVEPTPTPIPSPTPAGTPPPTPTQIGLPPTPTPLGIPPTPTPIGLPPTPTPLGIPPTPAPTSMGEPPTPTPINPPPTPAPTSMGEPSTPTPISPPPTPAPTSMGEPSTPTPIGPPPTPTPG